MPSASFRLLCLCIAEKVENPKCSKNSQNITEILFRQKTPGAKRTSPGGANSLQVTPSHGLGGRSQVAPGASGASLWLSFGLRPCFILEIILVNFERNPSNFPEQLF